MCIFGVWVLEMWDSGKFLALGVLGLGIVGLGLRHLSFRDINDIKFSGYRFGIEG